MFSVWLVMHELLPTYSMYVNAQCGGVYRTEASAVAAANRYVDEIFEGGDVDRDDENGCYEWSAGTNGSDDGTWDQRVFVERQALR